MARIRNYTNDKNITNDDLLVGSSYEGQGQTGAIYKTKNYKLSDLASYFSRNFDLGGVNYDLALFLDDLNKLKTNYTYDENGNLIGLSEAGVFLITNSEVSDNYATASFQANVTAKVVQFDANGNITLISEGFANSLMETTTTDIFAKSQFVDNLGASFGTVGEDGTITTFSSEYLDLVTAYSDANSSTASKLTNLNSTLNLLDANGNALYTNAEYLNNITTYVNTNSASAKIARGLNAEFGITDADGNTIKTKAEFDQEISTYVDENSATANIATKLNTEFGIVDPVTGETVKTGAQYLDEVTQHVDSNSATASKVTNLNSTLDILNEDGTVKKNSAQFLQDITTHVDENSATAGLVEDLGVTVGNIPLIFRQDDPPSLTETPIGSLWFDTNDNNKGYILVAGDPNVWTTVEDTEFTQFKSTYESVIQNTATESAATATKTTRLNAVLEILDEDGNLIPQSQSEYFETISNYVDQNSATAEKAETLRVAIEGADGTGGITAELNETSIAVASKPNVYRQDDEPVAPEGETIPLKSVWYDTNDNNKPYIYDGSPASWTEARDGKVTELESYALAQKTIEADANGVVTGITVKSENSGDPATAISDITFKTNTFNIVDQNDVNRLAFDQDGLTINGSGTFSGDISAASGTFGAVTIDSNGISSDNFTIASNGDVSIAGNLNGSSGTFGDVTINSDGISSTNFSIDSLGNVTVTGDITGSTGTFQGGLNIGGKFLVDGASGSTTIYAGDTSSRFEIQNDTGGSKFRLFGNKINFNSWIGGLNFDDSSNSNGPGFLQFGGVAYMYSGNGTTTTTNHHMTLDVYGGSKKLFLKADQITLRKSTTTGGSHTTIIEGDLEVQGNVSFTSSSSHPDTSSVSDSNNTGQTFIQNLVFDSYGHVTSFTSGTVSTDTPAIYADGSGNPQLTSGVTAAEVRSLIGAGTSSFSGDYADLSSKPTLGTAAAANVGDFATAGHNHTYNVNDAWLRDNGDDANVKLYGNSRQMVFRTDGTAEYASGVGGFAFAWMYGGDASSNRRMLLGSDGNLWTSAYGWLHDAFASAGHLHDTRYLRKDTNSSSSGTITAQDFILSSDQRLKSDINTYTVKPINIKYRDYVINSNRDRRRVGVLAQELEESHPEFVTTNPDTGYKAVSYIDMLVAKVAELEERIKQLENGGS